VLIDSDLKEINGYDITLKIREINTSIPIILLVNFSSIASLRLSNMVGCSQLLQNPVPPEELETIVLKHLHEFENIENP
jgi:two-component SAPR family response regulator